MIRGRASSTGSTRAPSSDPGPTSSTWRSFTSRRHGGATAHSHPLVDTVLATPQAPQSGCVASGGIALGQGGSVEERLRPLAARRSKLGLVAILGTISIATAVSAAVPAAAANGISVFVSYADSLRV